MVTFATPEPITAALTTAGALVQVAATDRPDTVVLVEPVNRASKSDVRVAENTRVGFSAGELTVKTTVSGDKNGSVAITVELPAGSRLVLSTARTQVRADGRLGDCQLDVASGRVQLHDIAALRANLAGGEVSIGRIAGTASVEGSSAGLRIGEVAGIVRYQGATGEVWIGHALSDIDLSSARGSFHIDRAEGSVTAKSGNCPIRIGRMTRGRAELVNASGGIDLGISEGSAARVDAESTKGEVRSSLPALDAAGESGSQVSIYARTRRDDIVIHPAAG
jgi:hypothetical protein